MPYSLGCGAKCDSSVAHHIHPKAQVNVVCHNTKLAKILFKQEPNVPLCIFGPNSEKYCPPDDTVKRAVKDCICCKLAGRLGISCKLNVLIQSTDCSCRLDVMNTHTATITYVPS